MSELENEAQEKEQEDTTELEIRAAFDEGISGDLEEDDIKMAMIGAGAAFKNVTRFYNLFLVDAGLALSKEDKAAHVTAALEGREFATEEQFDSAIEALVSEPKGINERSAGGLLRAYAKKNDLDVYKKPKSEGTGKSGVVQKYYDWLTVNPRVTEDEVTAWFADPANEASDNNRKMMGFFQKIRAMANTIAGV